VRNKNLDRKKGGENRYQGAAGRGGMEVGKRRRRTTAKTFWGFHFPIGVSGSISENARRRRVKKSRRAGSKEGGIFKGCGLTTKVRASMSRCAI